MKQFLTLMLAFVMVFTGMGIGSWGVDTAWADTQKITFSFSGVEDSTSVPCSGITIGEKEIKKIYIKTVSMDDGFEIGASVRVPRQFALTIDGKSIGANFKKGTYYGMEKDNVKNARVEVQTLKGRLGKIFIDNCKQDAEIYYFWSIQPNASEPYGLLIEVEGQSQVDRSKIDELIKTVWDGEKYTDTFYKENDRYNGSVSMERDNKNPTNGFWYELTKAGGALETAKGIFAKQEECDAAYQNLQSAIANLIPKTQLNATKLYEAIQAHGNYSEEFLENCTDVSAAAYRVTSEKAKAYLKLLFDEEKSEEYPEGAMKTVNVPENQGVADGYADELKNFSFLFKEDVTNATWNLKTINGLAKQYDMTENNGKYTKESWNAFVAARKAATEYAQEHPISNSMKAAEAQEYAKLARAFQSAIYGLKSEGKTVTVRFAYTDDYHLRFPNSADKDPTDNLPTIREYELSSGSTIEDLLKQIRYTYNNEKRFESSHYSVRAFFANGMRLYGYTPGVQVYLSETSYVLKDGDEIQLVHMDYPSYPYNYIYRSEVEWDKMAELLGILRLTESEKNAAAGEEIKLMVERTSAHPWTYTGTYSAFEGAVLAAYGPMKEDGSYP